MIQIHFSGNEMYILTIATQWAIVFSGIFLWVGMLTGVWKYYQIRHTERARAHYYVDIAHRSSLLYAAASLILAVFSHFTVLSHLVALLCVLANLFFLPLPFCLTFCMGCFKTRPISLNSLINLDAAHFPTG